MLLVLSVVHRDRGEGSKSGQTGADHRNPGCSGRCRKLVYGRGLAILQDSCAGNSRRCLVVYPEYMYDAFVGVERPSAWLNVVVAF